MNNSPGLACFSISQICFTPYVFGLHKQHFIELEPKNQLKGLIFYRGTLTVLMPYTKSPKLTFYKSCLIVMPKNIPMNNTTIL